MDTEQDAYWDEVEDLIDDYNERDERSYEGECEDE